MATSSAAADFVAKIPGLLSSGAFSDVTLICGGKVFKVHKAILCPQSKVFSKLLDGNFKESGAKFVNLPDDEPRVLQVLIHFMYHFTLDTTGRPTTSGLWTFLVHVYALADKYDLLDLRTLVVQRLNHICEPTENVDEFIAVLRVTDACTAEKRLWNILLPKVRANITLLLKDETFQELVMELPSLTIPLLGMLDHDKYMEALQRRQKSLSK